MCNAYIKTNKNVILYYDTTTVNCSNTPTDLIHVDKFYGSLPFYNNTIHTLLTAHETNLWSTIFCTESNGTSLSGAKDINPFIAGFLTNEEDDEIWGDCSNFVSGRPNEQLKESIQSHILTVTKNSEKWLAFLDFCFDNARTQGYLFEAFQKSYMLETLLFYINEHSPISVLPFIQGISAKYTGHDGFFHISDYIKIIFINKHAILIVPRRHGKTWIITLTIAAVLYAFPAKVLYICHEKSLSITVKQDVGCMLLNYTEKMPGIEFKWPNNGVDLTKRIFSQSGTDDSYNTPIMLNSTTNGDNNAIVGEASSARFVTGSVEKNIRGHNVEVCIVDEMLCINSNKFASIMAHGQKKSCKLTFLSSPVEKNTEMLLHMVNELPYKRETTMFYRVFYICLLENHIKYAKSQVACPRLMFYLPRHITFDDSNKLMTQVLTNNVASYDNELGILSKEDLKAGHPEDALRVSAFNQPCLKYAESVSCLYPVLNMDLPEKVFIYLDPAYQGTEQSGIALTATCLLPGKIPCILYMDHKYISVPAGDLLNVSSIIINMVQYCMWMIKELYEERHKKKLRELKDVLDDTDNVEPSDTPLQSMISKKRKMVTKMITNPKKTCPHFYFAMESNSNQADTTQVYTSLISHCKGTKKVDNEPFSLSLYYTKKNVRMMSKDGIYVCTDLEGYYLGESKRKIFSDVIYLMNNNQFRFSSLCGTKHINNKAGYSVIPYFVNQARHFVYDRVKNTYTGKITKRDSDDCIVTTIMAIHLAKTHGLNLTNVTETNFIQKY